MTKKELIEMLSQYPDDMRVVVSGYEGGYNDITECEEFELVLNYNTSRCFGAHEQKEYSYGNIEGKEIAPALYLY
mgnify:CR=1 FL=1